jgi:hypothetical protein
VISDSAYSRSGVTTNDGSLAAPELIPEVEADGRATDDASGAITVVAAIVPVLDGTAEGDPGPAIFVTVTPVPLPADSKLPTFTALAVNGDPTFDIEPPTGGDESGNGEPLIVAPLAALPITGSADCDDVGSKYTVGVGGGVAAGNGRCDASVNARPE